MPIGTFSGMQPLPKASLSEATSPAKSMLSASSLVRTMIRPQPARPASGPGAAGVHLDAGVGVDRDERGLDGAQGADHLADEVGIAGRVEKIEVLAGVIEVDERGLDRVLVMLLFVVEVADAGAGVDAGVSLDGAGFDEQLVDQRRLAGATVAADGDVPNVRNVLNHDSIPVPRKERDECPAAANDQAWAAGLLGCRRVEGGNV